jgi:hypothetical protein
LTHFTWLVPISAASEAVRAGNLASVNQRWDKEGVDLLDWHRKA